MARLPSSVRSGRPTGVTAPVKKRGRHSRLASLRSAALSRCRFSMSCFSLLPVSYCLLTMAWVTSFQKRLDSLGSWSASGGMVLASGISGSRSINNTGSCSSGQYFGKGEDKGGYSLFSHRW